MTATAVLSTCTPCRDTDLFFNGYLILWEVEAVPLNAASCADWTPSSSALLRLLPSPRTTTRLTSTSDTTWVVGFIWKQLWCALKRTQRRKISMAERVDPKDLATQLSGENVSEGASAGSGVSWERFSQWVCCVCVVTFDLELGQAMEVSCCRVNYVLSLSLSLSLSFSLSLTQ